MPHAAAGRRYGTVFNRVAAEYDRSRPGYPDELIDQLCQVGRLGAGDLVLEIGCGSGQLTGSLLARGLRVTALEPGDRLIALARHNLARHGGQVEFVQSGFEHAPLPQGHYRAVLSGSAMHWIDPDVGWQKAGEVMAADGTLGLIQYFGLRDPDSEGDQHALRAALAKIAPDVAIGWPNYRELQATLAGVRARRDNVSEVWAWLGDYELARDCAARLFDDVQLAAVPVSLEHTADELNALLGTMSFWARLSEPQRIALTGETQSLQKRLGRSIRSSTVACLVTARRARPA